MTADRASRVAVRLDERAIDAIVASIDQCHGPGGVVGVAVDGKPVYRKGFGLADMDAALILTPSTRLRVGSVTKQFTCLAYLLLCEAGAAQLDDPLGRYLPELHRVAHDVTVRQLMAHTSGLRDVYNIFFRFNDSRAHYAGAAQCVGSEELLQLYRDIDDVEAPPDTAWSYSNGGYLLLSAVIERITGELLEKTLADRVFGPIGMHDTSLLRSDTRFIGNRGSQHVVSTQGGFERMYFGVDNYLGGGAAISTVDDLLRWLAHMDRPAVGRAETWRVMRSAHKLANGAATLYGFGLQIERHRGVVMQSHPGGAFGGGAHVLKIPAAGLDVAILVNRQDAYAPSLAAKIVEACLVGLDPVAPTPAPSLPASGMFRSAASGCVIQLSTREERQIVSIDGGVDLPFMPDTAGILHYPDAGNSTCAVTLIGPQAQPTALRVNRFGCIDELVRVPPSTPGPGMQISGRYRSAAIHTQAAICEEPAGFLLRTQGPFGSVSYRLQSLSAEIWHARCVDVYRGIGIPTGIVTFDGDGASFRFSSGTTSSLRFARCA